MDRLSHDALPAGLPMTPTQALLATFELPLDDEHATPDSDLDSAARTPMAQLPSTRPRPITSGQQLQARQGVRLGSLNVMLRYEDGSELTEIPDVHLLPNAPAWFAGMVNLHGLLIPALDLALWLHAKEQTAAKPMLLVLGHGPDAAGVLIDGLPVRLRYDAHDTAVADDCAPHAIQRFVRSTHLIDDAVWFDLDVPGLLSTVEQALGPPQ